MLLDSHCIKDSGECNKDWITNNQYWSNWKKNMIRLDYEDGGNRRNLLEQSREPATNSTHIWRRRCGIWTRHCWKASALTLLRTGPAPPNPLVIYEESYKHTLFAFYAYIKMIRSWKKSVFLTVSCLSCYTCTSNVSWADCNSKMTKTACPSGTPNCAQSLETCTTAGGVKKQIFYKRCGTQGKDCQPKNSPSSCIGSTIPIFGFSSEDMCCSGNNCNSGPRYKVSSSLMGVLILLVFWSLHSCFTF